MPRALLPHRAGEIHADTVPDVACLDGSHQWGREVLGGKAAGIVAMRQMGLPVPPAFTVTTAVCERHQLAGDRVVDELWPRIEAALAWLESETGRVFGDGEHPLLVSVRSGAARSMPGMMDTVLNLGIDDAVHAALAGFGGAEYARTTRERFVDQFTKIVGTPPPAEPRAQLRAAILAVFASWEAPRAVAYRNHHGLSHDGGTAVTVQAMVFGNLDDRSGTGVLFSRNPLTGDDEPYGEWLQRGQGEDIVAGTSTPQPISDLAADQPEVYAELIRHAEVLEARGRDAQDIEFTVESGRLWLLQTRSAKRSAHAAIKIALSLHDRGVIDEREALQLVTSQHAWQVSHPMPDPAAVAMAEVLAAGLPACAGFAAGVVYDDPDAAEDAADEGHDVILCRETTSPDDIHGIIAAHAIVTELGGGTSHAAVVSREIGRPCVVGCGPGSLRGLAGREVTVDGAAGKVYAGRLPFVSRDEQSDPELARLVTWARQYSPLRAWHPDEAEPDTFDGADLDCDAAVHEVMAKGVREVCSENALPIMLAALHHRP